MSAVLFLLFLCAAFGQGVAGRAVSAVIVPTGNPATLSGRSAIQAFFSGPVIALGSDYGTNIPTDLEPFTFTWQGAAVPGKTRWVTTSIARFDPDIDWPPYLSFTMQIKVATTFDGVTTVTPLAAPITFTTGPATMYIGSVTSAFTTTSSEGTWSPTASYPSPDFKSTWTGPEVPNDGLITLRFSTDIDVATLQSTGLSITPVGQNTVISFTVSACGSDTTCAVVAPKGLQLDTQYRLTLNAGYKLNQYTGPVSSAISVTFYGLYGFRFSFPPNPSPKYFKYRLFVPHGLSTTSTGLSSAFQLTGPLGTVALQVSSPKKYYIELYAPDLLPSTTYALQIGSATVLDSWNNPLSNHMFSFTTSKRSSYILNGRPSSGKLAQFEDNITPLPNWNFTGQDVDVSCGGNHGKLSLTNVDSSNLMNAIASVYNPETSYVTSGSLTLVGSSNLVATPFGTSGVFLMETYFDCYSPSTGIYKANYFISKNKLGVSTLSSGDRVTVWVTDATTAAVISGATVKYVASTAYLSSTPGSFSVFSSATTDAEGLATITVNSQLYFSTIIVEFGGQMQIVTDMQMSPRSRDLPTKNDGALITDRGFYKPGDVVYIKGYVRNYFNGQLSVPTGKTWAISAQWPQSSTESFPVTVDPTFGSFDTMFTVPATANPGQVSMYLSADKAMSYIQTSFIISTPRIPTTHLTLKSSQTIYLLASGMPLSMNLATYTGVNIPNAKVSLQYTVTKYTPPVWARGGYFFGLDIFRPSTPSFSLSGSVDLTTDASGNINYVFSLATLNPTEVVPEGATLTLKAIYNSATKEQLTETLSASVVFSKYALNIRTSFSDQNRIWPNIPFGIFAGLVNVDTQTTITGFPVTFNLYPAATLPLISSDGGLSFSIAALQTCTLDLTSASTFGCSNFKLPGVGKYNLVASVLPAGATTPVSTVISLGQTSAEWTKAPIISYNDLYVILDKEEYVAGDTVTVTFYNPFGTDARALIKWGTGYGPQVEKTKVVQQLPAPNADGTTSLQFTLGAESPELSFVFVNFELLAPRATTGRLTGITVPISVLFDSDAPVLISKQFQFPVVLSKSKTLNVAVSVANPIIRPATTSTVTIEVSQGGAKLPNVEVAIFVVDKAVIDLVPHVAPRLDTSLSTPYISAYASFLSTPLSYLSYAASYAKTFLILKDRVAANPWYSSDYQGSWPLDPISGTSLDMTLTEYMSYFYTWLTDSAPYTYMQMPWDTPVFLADAFPGRSNTALGGKSAPVVPTTSNSVSVRTNFVTTPYFNGKVKTNAAGQAVVSFEVPDNLGTFEIRAFAITQDSNFGVGTANQIVRRELSMQYAGPKIVRVKDKFEAGVVITASDPSFNQEVIVEMIRACDQLDLLGTYDSASPPGIKRVLNGVGPHLVNFAFVALGVGEVAIGWTVRLSNTRDYSDAAIFYQSSVGQQEPVYIATSMAVTPAATITEGFKAPASVPFSGDVDVNVGVGRFPAVQAFSDLIDSRLKRADTQWISAEDYLGTLASQFAKKKYSVPEVAPLIDTTIARLSEYTDSTYGLQYYGPSVLSYKYTSAQLQALGLFVSSLITGTGVGNSMGVNILSATTASTLSTLTSTWRVALDNELTRQAQLARTYKYSPDYETLAFVYLGTGISFVPTDADMAFSKLMANTNSLSVGGKAALILAIDRDWVVTQKPSTATLLTALSDVRTQGRTMYIASAPGAQNPTFLGTVIGLIDLLTSGGSGLPLDKLANWVAQSDSATQPWLSSSQLVYSMVSLAVYDDVVQNTNPKLTVDVQNDAPQRTLISATFSSPLDQPVHQKFLFEEIHTVTFSASGSGEASVVFGATFVPAIVNTVAVYRGISVNKVIQRVDPVTFAAVGAPISSANIGETVRVTIEVTVPDYSPFLVVSDPFPGAIEPLDTNIYSFSSGKGYVTPVNYDFMSWWNPPVVTQYQQDKVTFLAGSVYAGTQTFSYLALVNSEGEFGVGPAIAYDKSQPELMGLSAGSTFTTKAIAGLPVGSDGTCIKLKQRQIDPSSVPAIFGLSTTTKASSINLMASIIFVVVSILVSLIVQ